MNMREKDLYYMRAALRQARLAAAADEVPVGAVIVRDGQIIATGRNRREQTGSALWHAEMVAIERACAKLGQWRLDECALYVTLEPCPMCAGAILNARIRRVVIGAADPKGGAMGSVISLFDYPFNHKPETERGILAARSSQLLKSFFAGKRSQRQKGAAANPCAERIE